MHVYDANYIASALNECKIEMEDWFEYALELETQGRLDDAELALDEAILFEEDVLHWAARLEEWMVEEPNLDDLELTELFKRVSLVDLAPEYDVVPPRHWDMV